MRLLNKATKVIDKAVDKAATTASDAVSKMANISKNTVLEQIKKAKEDDDYLYKLVFAHRTNAVRDDSKIYDGEGNVIYKAKGSFLIPPWSIELSDPYGLILGKIHKKVVSLRSPLKRYEGDNVEFEIVINRNKLGSLKNKELGSLFDGVGKIINDLKSSFEGLHYEYDFNDMEIVDKGLIFGYEIRNKLGDVLSKSKQSFNYYTINHSKKEDELLYLMMIIAMDFIQDEQLKKNTKRYGRIGSI